MVWVCVCVCVPDEPRETIDTDIVANRMQKSTGSKPLKTKSSRFHLLEKVGYLWVWGWIYCCRVIVVVVFGRLRCGSRSPRTGRTHSGACTGHEFGDPAQAVPCPRALAGSWQLAEPRRHSSQLGAQRISPAAPISQRQRRTAASQGSQPWRAADIAAA